ncbi:MAG: hypothetical protein HY446_00895 [Candidatus Niyogibacteria bacterium]|nr:hypothetical protein [Candidatus Niyogibacteria bacterium]
MWIVEVFPITKSPIKDETLTYFSTKEIEPGALVEAVLRNKAVPAVVFRSEKAESRKASLKRESFSLKKISRILSDNFISSAFLQAVGETSEYFLASPSSLLQFFLPKTFLKKSGAERAFSDFEDVKAFSEAGFKVSMYQATRPERFKYYRSAIREALGRGGSVLILLPTISLAEEAFADLRVGIEDRVFLLHGDLPAKIVQKTRKEISDSKNAVVSVGTAPVLSVLRKDSALLIVDEESNENYYHSIRRPFFDLRKFAEFLAARARLHLIFGDIILRLGADESRFLPLSVSRILSPAESRIIDARPEKFSEFRIISRELEELLKTAVARKESVAVIGHRRGFSPITLCKDCGHVITCPNCASPLVIHQQSQKNPNSGQKVRFFCHYCLKKEAVLERCPNCASWRLAEYGTGVEKIGQELKRIFPEINIFRFDRDAVKTRKEAERVKNEFLERPGAFLVATEFFLNFFKNPLPHITVISIDGLFSIPDYRLHERVMGFLTRLRALSQKSFVVQTRLPELPLFQHALNGNLSGFKSEEFEERRKLSYPPAVDLIKITLEDANRARLTSAIERLAKEIKEAEPEAGAGFECVDFPAFIVRIKGRFKWHILLRFSRGAWPGKHEKIRAVLKNLSPGWAVQVDPPSLL